ncbi:MAG: phage terminase small subunit P27 family [gamma proteobacterium symbiont of Ctena orbiculata]|nr:MAG: phage terminase small subunit P27 family [gamma proteobacterium symbiont of Ctena orbiculata]
MGQRGPKPKPAQLHVLNGNPSKKKAHELLDAVQPDTEIPDVPAHLMPDAKIEWYRISVELEKLGLISQLDRAALAAYCQAYGRWVMAENKMQSLGDRGLVAHTPNGFEQMSVWLQISNRAQEQMHKFMAEFGMTPSARSRVTPSTQLSLPLEDDNSNDQKSPGRFFSRTA